MHDPNNPNSLSSNNVKSICLDSKGIMWIGTFDGGLNRYDSATGRFAHYRHDPEDSTSISDNDVYSIVEDKGGDLWLATHFGVNVLDRATNQFVRHIHGEPQSISHNDCKVVYRDRSDQIWIGTFDGLNLYHSEDNSFEKFHHITGDSTTVSASHIQCLYEDDAGSFWIGTLGGGLNRMDREKKTFAAYTEKDGLMDNSVYGILEDEIGNLWLSSNDGLSRFDPERKTFRNYDTDDGLHSDQFTYNAFAKGATGELFFGGLQGFTSFFPDEIRDNEFIPSVVFTDFLIFNRSVVPDSIGSPLLKPISETSEIFLKHEQSVITFEFAALNFVSSNENEYAYMLENFDSQWHAIGPKRTVTFTNLDAGEYTLRVRGSNNDGRWNEDGASLRLVITPPYWGTLWFRSTIFAALVLGIFAFLRIRTNSISRSNAQLQQVVDKRTEELLAANRELETFAYSVSHDLRAPLRGINGFSQVLFEEYQDKLDQKGVDYIERIQRATRRMGKLIDSLLELSRIARRELVRSSIDVTSMAHSIVTELQQANPGRKVDFMVEPDLYVEADPELFRIVLENLLRNAWKFTEMTEKARVELGRTKAGEKGAFFIRDNGVGFDMAYANNLFVPFHRLHSGNDFEGTGIGLATVKRIISRHGGKVWAEGDRDKGATFYFKL
jgi:signal transduction histidine kinase